MNEHFLVTWENADGDICFLMFPMTEYEKMSSLIKKLINKIKSKLSVVDIDKLIWTVKKTAVKDCILKMYDITDWPFADDNIKKIINLPEFGW
jgi:hypothetical protein